MSTSGGRIAWGELVTPHCMLPPPPVTSPPLPELRPTPVLPLDAALPLLAAFPELTPPPVGTSPEPAWPGLNPQPARAEIKTNFTSCPCKRSIGDLRRKGAFRMVGVLAYARSLKSFPKNVPT